MSTGFSQARALIPPGFAPVPAEQAETRIEAEQEAIPKA